MAAGRPLSCAESRLMEASANGAIADFSPVDSAANRRASPTEWTDQPALSAQVVRHLLSGSNPAWSVTRAGVRVVGARITGVLDLADTAIDFPIAFVNCHFDRELSLRGALVAATFPASTLARFTRAVTSSYATVSTRTD
jgi:hypothetical protein